MPQEGRAGIRPGEGKNRVSVNRWRTRQPYIEKTGWEEEKRRRGTHLTGGGEID